MRSHNWAWFSSQAPLRSLPLHNAATSVMVGCSLIIISTKRKSAVLWLLPLPLRYGVRWRVSRLGQLGRRANSAAAALNPLIGGSQRLDGCLKELGNRVPSS
jgi:hypothetical protein